MAFQDFSKDYQSDYNVAMGSMIRLQEALLSINQDVRARDYNGYFLNLSVVYYEVHPYLSKQEIEEIKKIKEFCIERT